MERSDSEERWIRRVHSPLSRSVGVDEGVDRTVDDALSRLECEVRAFQEEQSRLRAALQPFVHETEEHLSSPCADSKISSMVVDVPIAERSLDDKHVCDLLTETSSVFDRVRQSVDEQMSTLQVLFEEKMSSMESRVIRLTKDVGNLQNLHKDSSSFSSNSSKGICSEVLSLSSSDQTISEKSEESKLITSLRDENVILQKMVSALDSQFARMGEYIDRSLIHISETANTETALASSSQLRSSSDPGSPSKSLDLFTLLMHLSSITRQVSSENIDLRRTVKHLDTQHNHDSNHIEKMLDMMAILEEQYESCRIELEDLQASLSIADDEIDDLKRIKHLLSTQLVEAHSFQHESSSLLEEILSEFRLEYFELWSLHASPANSNDEFPQLLSTFSKILFGVASEWKQLYIQLLQVQGVNDSVVWGDHHADQPLFSRDALSEDVQLNLAQLQHVLSSPCSLPSSPGSSSNPAFRLLESIIRICRACDVMKTTLEVEVLQNCPLEADEDHLVGDFSEVHNSQGLATASDSDNDTKDEFLDIAGIRSYVEEKVRMLERVIEQAIDRTRKLYSSRNLILLETADLQESQNRSSVEKIESLQQALERIRSDMEDVKSGLSPKRVSAVV